MKVAMVNLVRPQPGSGDGLTEYAWQIYSKLRKSADIDLIYPLEKLKMQDTLGILYANSLFRLKVRKLAKGNYDVIHITHPELGFVAKMLKEKGTRARIVSSVHDLMRLDKGFHKGIMQGAYNLVVSANIGNAIRYSDMIIFTSSAVKNEVLQRFRGEIKNWRITLLGTKDRFLAAKIPKKKKRKTFVIGYVGALIFRKNVIFILKTAEQLKSQGSNFKFLIYGSGDQKEHLMAYKAEKKLDNVEFMGFAPEGKLMHIYDSFDAFIWPSVSDSSSFPIEDAKARGLPIIVSKENKFDVEVTRYAYVAQDASDAAKRIMYLRKHGYDDKMRKQALAYAKSISWSNTARKTLEAYKDVLKVRTKRYSE